MKFRTIYSLVLITLLTASVSHAQPAAQQATQKPAPAKTAPANPGSATKNPDNPAMPTKKDETAGNISYVYERPTFEKFSQLFWALSKMDINKNADVDFFLMINECDIYKDYFHNEFEWQTIRQSSKEFLTQNKSTFPLRYEMMQPLKLGEYNTKTEKFEIMPEYQIKNTRRFEIMANNYTADICNYGNRAGEEIPGYPRGLLIELTRPIMITSLPVDPVNARLYIEEKLKSFKGLQAQHQNVSNLYLARDAYLVMKIKFFAYRKDLQSKASGYQLAEVLGILEGIEVYADRKKKKLLYVEDYRRKPKVKKANPLLALDKQRTPLLLDDPTDFIVPAGTETEPAKKP